MAYEIELTVGQRTYHYGSFTALGEDAVRRQGAIDAARVNAMRGGISKERKQDLLAHAAAMEKEFNGIKRAATELNSSMYR